MAIFDRDHQVRSAIFHWLSEQRRLYGDVLSHGLLSHGFQFEGERVPLLGPQGIFKPKVLPELPLSITTSPNSPYDDELHSSSGMINYCYRGHDPMHPDNVRLRKAMQRQVPLVYFFGTRKGWYVPTYPVFVVADDPKRMTVSIQTDDERFLADYAHRGAMVLVGEEPGARREYHTVTAKRRVHQQVFRDRVLAAYRTRCALCRLRHGSLLDAAHIVPDSEPNGLPIVSNGLSLCKIHHAAYDLGFLGIGPDCQVQVNPRLLEEVDGPMLQHGIKEMHGHRIEIPQSSRLRPDRERLAWRFERFLAALG